MKNKVVAKLVNYTYGNLYYTVELSDGIYQFPISTIDTDTDATSRLGRELLYLSSDLGTTSFYAEMKASELNRWIAKAVEKDEFVKIS